MSSVAKYGTLLTRRILSSVRCFRWVAATWALCGPVAPALSQAGVNALQPVIESCSNDLDGDGQQDLVLRVATGSGFDTIALLRRRDGYRAYLLDRTAEVMKLTCEVGTSVRSTTAGVGTPVERVFRTPGAFVSLKQPEGAAVSYIWTGKFFLAVWTAD